MKPQYEILINLIWWTFTLLLFVFYVPELSGWTKVILWLFIGAGIGMNNATLRLQIERTLGIKIR